MRLSVVVGTMNVGGKEIERLIMSFAEQEYSDKELIIVDGGSTDDTVETLKKYDDLISCWISEPDNGLVDAYNKGVKLSTGSFICFMGGSDWFNKGVFDEIVKAYNESGADVLYGDCALEQPNGELIMRSAGNVDLDSLYYSSSAFCTAGTFAKKEIFEMLEGVDLKIANDVFMWGMAHRKGYRFHYVDSGCPIAFFSCGGVSSTKEYPLWKDVRKARLMVIEGSYSLSKRWRSVLDSDYGIKMARLYKRVLPINEYLDLMSDSIEESENYVIWGSGYYGKEIYAALLRRGKKISHIVDSAADRQGCVFENMVIESPRILNNETKAEIIIAVSDYEAEIRRQIDTIISTGSVKVDSVGSIMYRAYLKRGDGILDKAYSEGIIG